MIPKVQVYSCILIARISSIRHIMNNIRDLCNGLDNFFLIFIYLAVLGLSCSLQGLQPLLQHAKS